jgi:hypothetical protein
MRAQTVRLVGESQRNYAHRLIDSAPAGWVMKLAAETRRDAQNRKLHPMIQDCINQTERFKGYSMEDAKLTFMNALRSEMRFLPSLEGQGAFPVGSKTSTLTVEQFSGLIEVISEWGARNGVRWSEPHDTRSSPA